MSLSQSFTEMGRVAKNWNPPRHTFPAEVKQDNALLSCFISHAVNKCPFFGLFSATGLAFLYSWPLNNKGVRGSDPCTVENLHIKTLALCICSSASADSTEDGVVLEYLLLKTIYIISGPVQLKLVLFKGQLYCWWSRCFTCPPGIVLKCCPVFLRARRLWGALWRKYVC